MFGVWSRDLALLLAPQEFKVSQHERLRKAKQQKADQAHIGILSLQMHCLAIRPPLVSMCRSVHVSGVVCESTPLRGRRMGGGSCPLTSGASALCLRDLGFVL